MKSICVYCGSSIGSDPDFEKSALALGERFANDGITLVYGGSKIGIMGAVANACLENGGNVTGIIPHFLDRVEITNTDATHVIQTETMHERKTKMAEHSDGFIALPGGFGTLEELAEMLTWSQLGLVPKPIGILNVNGFYNHLLALFDHMSENGLLNPKNLELFVAADNIDDLLEGMQKIEPSDSPIKDKLDLT